MKERWTTVEPDADEKQEQQFHTWLSGKDIPFEESEAEKAYRERVTLLKDAIQLKKPPHRVPICPSPGFFPVEYAQRTLHEAMYDYDELARIWKKYWEDFSPDAYYPPTAIVPGRVIDVLDFKLYQWPGHGVSKERPYQFVEGEYMKEDEYQEFIDDPTSFFMKVFLPRIFGALKSLEVMPVMTPPHEIVEIPTGVLPFGTPALQKALNDLMQAGSEAARWFNAVGVLNRSIMGKGYPSFTGGFSKAPFDVIGDSLRGTAGVMMDMYKHPDELSEACERLVPSMVSRGVAAGKANGHCVIFMPLHKGADGFMSDKHFQTFYWPTLKKVVIGLINEGFVPLLFAEGGYNSRLEVISDLPKGKTVWWFENTDMARAKQTVGKVACIAGNVPLPLLCTGTPGEVKNYCKALIDVAGRGGGFILSSGAGMDGSKSAKVKAMIEFTKEYGSYHNLGASG